MKRECEKVKVHSKNMLHVEQVTYLGEILSADAKNTKNVQARVSKGMGLINEILYILENMALGPFYFSIAIMLRDSILINGMIYNIEAWSNLTKEDIEELSKIDRLYLSKIFNVPRSKPKESFYLENGIMEIGMILKNRRLNYFKDIMSRKKKEMLFNFITVQWNKPSKGVWTEFVTEDFKEIDIDNPFELVEQKSKMQLKN